MPVVGRGGLLHFQEESHDFSPLSIRVPKEVAQDQNLLQEYCWYKFEKSDFFGTLQVNIWDKEKKKSSLLDTPHTSKY